MRHEDCQQYDVHVFNMYFAHFSDDLAESIKDGRYGRQKEKMLTWRQKYDVLNVGTNLTYVVEGEAAPYVVRCPDACQGVGKCGNPTVEEVQVS